MRKIKKINGFLVVRFNDREKRNYPDLGSFGVIDAEQYTGDIDFDRDAIEKVGEYPALVMRKALHDHIRELAEMYENNYAVQKFKEGMQP